MTSIFEQLSGTYTQGSDGMLYPNLTLGDREQRPIGRWGRIHRVYRAPCGTDGAAYLRAGGGGYESKPYSGYPAR